MIEIHVHRVWLFNPEEEHMSDQIVFIRNYDIPRLSHMARNLTKHYEFSTKQFQLCFNSTSTNFSPTLSSHIINVRESAE